ncbi:hypothetical protein QUA16_18565, partial [Microcoleus sp. S13_C3]|uniref:hypothetical protein n=1 Tax=Microcoleus sp. AT13-A6 TaxID=2818591 RepID=UPI002FD33532
VRSQKSEVRSQKSEVRSQKSEVRSQKSEGKRPLQPDRPQKLSISSSWVLNLIFPYANFPAN